ncbi:MAG: flavodoxin family protein [Methanospirillaceae archaeon]|nr:flavodoxin family protein [Methanospirillaceae archaeon]
MTYSILAFAGSPRRHGNSETLLDWVLEAMEGWPGVSTEKIVLVQSDILPCRGCNSCEKTNRCVIHDDLDTIYDKITSADCVILAAPIYCMSICSQAKALIDRAQLFRSRKYVLHLPVTPPEQQGMRMGLFISTAGQNWDYVFDASLPVITCFFHVIDIKNRDIRYLLINNVDEKGAILSHPRAQKKAVAMAGEIIRALQEKRERGVR